MGLGKVIARNLKQPTGLFGKLVGMFMDNRNDFMNRFTIQLLDPQKDDHILEIGFGNGKYIKEIANIADHGFVAGIDFSEIMVKEAQRRNKTLINRGIVDIKLGAVNKIEYDTHTFDKVFTVNTIYFWPNPETDLQEIYRVLKPNGILMISFRSEEAMEKLKFTNYDFKLYKPEEVVQLLSDAGFYKINLESSQDKSMDVHCVIARKV